MVNNLHCAYDVLFQLSSDLNSDLEAPGGTGTPGLGSEVSLVGPQRNILASFYIQIRAQGGEAGGRERISCEFFGTPYPWEPVA